MNTINKSIKEALFRAYNTRNRNNKNQKRFDVIFGTIFFLCIIMTIVAFVKRNAPDTPIVYVVNGTNRFKATKKFMEFFKEEHKDEPIYCLPQSEAFVQSRLANQSVVAYNPRLPAALATSVLTHGVWKILKLKF